MLLSTKSSMKEMPPCSLLMELKSSPATNIWQLLHLASQVCPLFSQMSYSKLCCHKRYPSNQKVPRSSQRNTQQHWNNTRHISKEQENHWGGFGKFGRVRWAALHCESPTPPVQHEAENAKGWENWAAQSSVNPELVLQYKTRHNG